MSRESHVSPGVLSHQDAQVARGLGRRVGQQRLDRLQLGEDFHHRTVQKFALLGQNQAARVAMEQRHLEIGLKR